jgi:ABC-type enterobactin transport system permease subunit
VVAVTFVAGTETGILDEVLFCCASYTATSLSASDCVTATTVTVLPVSGGNT